MQSSHGEQRNHGSQSGQDDAESSSEEHVAYRFCRVELDMSFGINDTVRRKAHIDHNGRNHVSRVSWTRSDPSMRIHFGCGRQ